MKLSIEALTDIALFIAENAGEALLDQYKNAAPVVRGTSKEVHIQGDKIADKVITQELQKTVPDHSYVTEESGFVDNNSEYLWIVDPLDGSGNYANHNPFFAVSISLWKNNEPMVSVIEAPGLDERYVASGKSARKVVISTGIESELQPSKVDSIENAYIVFCEGSETVKKRTVKLFDTLYTQAKDMRKLGSAAMELAWVATGRAEIYITQQISLWDIAAGMHILKNVGGNVTDFASKELQWKDFKWNQNYNIIASNNNLTIPKVDHVDTE